MHRECGQLSLFLMLHHSVKQPAMHAPTLALAGAFKEHLCLCHSGGLCCLVCSSLSPCWPPDQVLSIAELSSCTITVLAPAVLCSRSCTAAKPLPSFHTMP